MGKVIQLQDKHKKSIERYLSISPLENLKILFILKYGDIKTFSAYLDNGKWKGVINYDWETFIYVTDNSAIEPLVNDVINKDIKNFRLTGRKETVDKFWNIYSKKMNIDKVHLDRELIVQELHKDYFDFSNNDYIKLEVAKEEDAIQVADLVAAMNKEEVGVDFYRSEKEKQEYRELVLNRIKNGMYYVYKENNKVKFTIMVSFFTDYATQIDEAYVIPEERGKGIATKCIRYFCNLLLLNLAPRICGIACESNLPPLKYLKKLGFKPVFKLRSIYVNNENS
ncbi:MAG: hypothetical protein KatS3mg068_2433 [Candidatus Sericytochromatia bacterium]|nr:MAG: hypothetical protein KatS3mg068_2433 [Candidatus Sericytochromatia bacterium]